jgi:hypothetical protein
MKTRWRSVAVVLGFAILLVAALLVGHRKEPVYQRKPLRYWVKRLGSDELHGAPKDAVAAVRAIGPKAVPFLLAWMPEEPHRPSFFARVWQTCSELLHLEESQEDDERLDPQDIEIAWWALGSEGKSAIPSLARIISRPLRTIDDYSAWTHSAKVISFLGPDAIAPMLTAATNMQGKHDMWELLHNMENLGTNGAPAVPALVHWANDSDYWVRDGVVSALGGIGKHPDLAVPVLLAALKDPNSMVRRDAANALGAFAEDSDAVLPALIKTLSGDDWEAREGAASGLGRIPSKPEIVVPLIAPYLYDRNSVVARSAAYALRGQGSRAALLALLRTTNDVPGVSGGIADIVYGAVEIISGEEEEKRRKDAISKLAAIYARGEVAPLTDPKVGGGLLSEVLSGQAVAGPQLKLEQMLTLRRITTTDAEDMVTFELPMNYDALTNTGTLRLLCDSDPGERLGDEAVIQECRRGTNGNCWLAWDTSYEFPGQHFLQAELIVFDGHSRAQQGINTNMATVVKGPLLAFVSTNDVQCFPHADTYTEHGAFFRVKLAQPVGSYSLALTTPSGEPIHTLTGSTTNGIAEVQWDLHYDGGKRYTGESFNTTWRVTFPGSSKSGSPSGGGGMGDRYPARRIPI